MVAGILLALVSDATAQQRPCSPLGDLTTMTIQPRHVKLGFAGREANWLKIRPIIFRKTSSRVAVTSHCFDILSLAAGRVEAGCRLPGKARSSAA
jgi:hypothetical protein